MASLAKRSIKIIAFVDETFHHLLLPKIEALSPYAIVLDAGSDIEKYNPENLKEANVLKATILNGLDVHIPKMHILAETFFDRWANLIVKDGDSSLNSDC